MRCAFPRCQRPSAARGVCADHHRRLYGRAPDPNGGNLVKLYRDKRDLTQRELAGKLGVAPSTVDLWEKKENDRLVALALIGLDRVEEVEG